MVQLLGTRCFSAPDLMDVSSRDSGSVTAPMTAMMQSGPMKETVVSVWKLSSAAFKLVTKHSKLSWSFWEGFSACFSEAIWKSLPNSVESCNSLNTFKHAVHVKESHHLHWCTHDQLIWVEFTAYWKFWVQTYRYLLLTAKNVTLCIFLCTWCLSRQVWIEEWILVVLATWEAGQRLGCTHFWWILVLEILLTGCLPEIFVGKGV